MEPNCTDHLRTTVTWSLCACADVPTWPRGRSTHARSDHVVSIFELRTRGKFSGEFVTVSDDSLHCLQYIVSPDAHWRPWLTDLVSSLIIYPNLIKLISLITPIPLKSIKYVTLVNSVIISCLIFLLFNLTVNFWG